MPHMQRRSARAPHHGQALSLVMTGALQSFVSFLLCETRKGKFCLELMIGLNQFSQKDFTRPNRSTEVRRSGGSRDTPAINPSVRMDGKEALVG